MMVRIPHRGGFVEELSTEVVDGVQIADVVCSIDVVAVAGDFEYQVKSVDMGVWGYQATACTDITGVRAVAYDPTT